MIEDLPDDIVTEDDLDDVEPVGDEANSMNTSVW